MRESNFAVFRVTSKDIQMVEQKRTEREKFRVVREGYDYPGLA